MSLIKLQKNNVFINGISINQQKSNGSSLYRCISVDRLNHKWCGNKVVCNTNGYSFELTITKDLDYTVIQPQIYGIYSQDALIIIDQNNIYFDQQFLNQNKILNEGLLGYYKFKNNSLNHITNMSDAVDHNVTYQNNYVKFNGSDSYINLSKWNSLQYMQQATICFWLYMDEYPNTKYKPFQQNSNLYKENIFVDSNGMIGIGYRNKSNREYTQFLTQIIFPLKQWHFLSCVYDFKNGFLKLYLDNQLVAQNSLALYSYVPYKSIIINSFEENQTVVTAMQDLTIWNKQLTNSEIQLIYHNATLYTDPNKQFLNNDYNGRLNIEIIFPNNIVRNTIVDRVNKNYCDWQTDASGTVCLCGPDGCCGDFWVSNSNNKEGWIGCEDYDGGYQCNIITFNPNIPIPLNVNLVEYSSSILHFDSNAPTSVIITKLD